MNTRTARGLLPGLLLGAVHLSADILYSVTNLGSLGGFSTQGAAINNAGQVVGYSFTSDGAQHAFLYSHGQMTDLGALGGSNSSASGINNAGQVVGSSEISASSHTSHAFDFGILKWALRRF